MINTGLKHQIAELLRTQSERHPGIGLTIGQIGSALDLPKTEHGSLSAALVKLRDESRVKSTRGPATSSLGPRFVKVYIWRGKQEKPVVIKPDDDRRFLSFMR